MQAAAPGAPLIAVRDLWDPHEVELRHAIRLASHHRVKHSTRVGYAIKLRRAVTCHIGDRPLVSLTVDDMAELMLRMEEAGYEPITIRDAFAITSAVLDYAVRNHLITANPARQLPARERPRVNRRPARTLTPNEIAALLAAAREPYRTIFAIGIFAGLRSGEIRGLQWRDIDLANRPLHIRRQAQDGQLVPPKTPNAVRDVALLDPLPDALERYRSRGPQLSPSSLLFFDKGKPLRAPRLR